MWSSRRTGRPAGGLDGAARRPVRLRLSLVPLLLLLLLAVLLLLLLVGVQGSAAVEARPHDDDDNTVSDDAGHGAGEGAGKGAGESEGESAGEGEGEGAGEGGSTPGPTPGPTPAQTHAQTPAQAQAHASLASSSPSPAGGHAAVAEGDAASGTEDPFQAWTGAGDADPTWLQPAVAAWEDTTPPALLLENLDLDPPLIDASAARRSPLAVSWASATVLFSVTPEVAAAFTEVPLDDLFQPVELHFASPLGHPLIVTCDEAALRPRMRPPHVSCRAVADLPAANANGHWELQMVVERSAPAIGGALIYTRDDLFEMGLPTGFDVINSPSDNAAPTLLSVNFMVSPEGTDWPEAHICIRFRDQPSGLSLGLIKSQLVSQLRMRSTLGRIWRPAWAFLVPHADARFEGTLCSRITFPAERMAVLWEVDYLYLIDDVGNGAYFTSAALAAHGHPIHVLLPAPFHRTVPPPAATTSNQPAGADAEVGPNAHVDGRPV